MEIKKILKELKRRKIYQVAIAYAITAWLLAQIASIATTSFEAPPWVMKMIIIFLLLGFPIALILAWAFELTPDGIVKTNTLIKEENNQDQPKENKRSKWIKWIVGSVICILLISLFYNKWWLKEKTNDTNIVKSIAVLPFDSNSSQEENQFFAEAIADEIRSQLLSVKGLKVVSGYSSKYYKGQNVSPKQVGDELGVEFILQGNVQQLVTSVKVAVELSHTQSNNLEWSPAPFERKMEDIFHLENEIARQIVQHLRVRLTSKEQAEFSSLPTTNPEAYQLFLRGQELMHRNRTNFDEIDRAIELLQKATDLDTNFDRAYLGLAEAYLDFSLWGRISTNEATHKALNAIFRVSKGHKSAEYYSILGAINLNRREKDLAKYFLERSLEMNPNNLFAKQRLGWLYFAEGKTNEAVAYMDAAQALDPKDPIYCGFNAYAWYYDRQFEKGLTVIREGMKTHPEDNFLKWTEGLMYAGMKEYEKAIEIFNNRSMAQQTNWMIGYCYGMIGETKKAEFVLDYLLNKRKQVHVPAHMIASVYIGLGEKEKALDWLEIDVEEGGHEHFYWGMARDIRYAPIRNEDRFQNLLDEINSYEKISNLD